MTSIQKELGFCPESMSIQTQFITITPLENHEDIVSRSLLPEHIHNDWYYTPSGWSTQHIWGSDGSLEISGKLPFPSRVFSLPKTHLIKHSRATNENHVDFLIWALSFFTGMRLTPTQAGFLDSTPIKPYKLVDFTLSQPSLQQSLDLADRFWTNNISYPNSIFYPIEPRRFAAAVHALFISQNPQSLQFEKFIYLYTALDACFRIAADLFRINHRRISHADRIHWTCQQFGMQTPGWASAQAGSSTTEVSSIRNAAIHEALFLDEPLGFSIQHASSGPNLILEMKNLLCRFLVAIICHGSNRGSRYIHSSTGSRRTQQLKLT